MHDADRATVLAALKQQLNRFESLGLERTTALSAREYLTSLAAAGVVDAETARQAAGVYEMCRFGKGSIVAEDVEAALSALEAGAARVEAMDETTRSSLVQPSVRKAVPRAGRRPEANISRQGPALSRAARGSSTANREAAKIASRRKRRAERGPSRLWTFIACGLVMWTLAVAVGSLWQHDRIERMLGSSEWGRPLMSHLRGERQDHSDLRLRVEADKRTATASDFARLAEQYLVRREYAEAIHAFQQGLAREASDAQQADMLNTLAWMLLTADDPWYRDAIQAQKLAQRAVELCEEPEHFDTLAVAYFQNNDLVKAIEMERTAVNLAAAQPESLGDKRYYDQQLRDFELAAKVLGKLDSPPAVANVNGAPARLVENDK
jgi:hypothetical protein